MSTHPDDMAREERLRELEVEEQETERIQEYVDRIGWFRWGWEARANGWHVDAGVARTRRGAHRRAVRSLRERDE